MRGTKAREFNRCKGLQGDSEIWGGKVTAKWGMVSAEELAETIGVTDRAVRELATRGIVIKLDAGKYDRAASVRAYCNHLREVAAGRGGEEAQLNLSAEKARLAKEQADGQALKNASLRRELVSAAEVEREWSVVLRGVRSQMLGIPSRLQQRLPHLVDQI
jgi:phage terminase Nu1 subunit (DNA packaging protein)